MSIQHTLSFPIQQFETATSYVSRLALWCGLGSPSDLCLDWGFRWQDVVRGDDFVFERVDLMLISLRLNRRVDDQNHLPPRLNCHW